MLSGPWCCVHFLPIKVKFFVFRFTFKKEESEKCYPGA